MKAHTTKQYRTLKGKIESEVKHAQKNPGKFDFDRTVRYGRGLEVLE